MMENIPVCKRPLIIIGALCSEYANQIQIIQMYDMYSYSQVTFVYLIRA